MAAGHRRCRPVGRGLLKRIGGLEILRGYAGVRRQCTSRGSRRGCAAAAASSRHDHHTLGASPRPAMKYHRWACTRTGTARHFPGWSRRFARTGSTRSPCRRQVACRVSRRKSSVDGATDGLYYPQKPDRRHRGSTPHPPPTQASLRRRRNGHASATGPHYRNGQNLPPPFLPRPFRHALARSDNASLRVRTYFV